MCRISFDRKSTFDVLKLVGSSSTSVLSPWLQAKYLFGWILFLWFCIFCWRFIAWRMALLDVTRSCLDSISQVNLNIIKTVGIYSLISNFCKPFVFSNFWVIECVSAPPTSDRVFVLETCIFILHSARVLYLSLCIDYQVVFM